MALADIFLRKLRFSGPLDLLNPLRQAEIGGKLLSIEGRLCQTDRRFVVTAVGSPTEQ